MNDNDKQRMPPSVAVAFQYDGTLICSVPIFLLRQIILKEGKICEDDRRLNMLMHGPDTIASMDSSISEQYLRFLQENLAWDKFSPYLSYTGHLDKEFKCLWNSLLPNRGSLSIRFHSIAFPDKIYRYFQFCECRACQLFSKGKLFLPSPNMFNDPFDCSLDGKVKKTFENSAVGCFSMTPDNVLMFSHYADNHRGFAVGFDTRCLIDSITTKYDPAEADIRPVWYFRTMPALDLKTEPALCATCKSDIWSYENEFRLFVAKNKVLEPSGTFSFDRAAIKEVIYGCRALKKTTNICKALTRDLVDCEHWDAIQTHGQFGVTLEKCK